MRALIASGSGRYGDPWHPFERTSPIIAELLRERGFDVSVHGDVDTAMTSLEDVDLLVVNAGDPWRGADQHEGAPAEAVASLAAALNRGIGVVAVHCAVSSLRDYPEWFPAIGGMWIPGLSFHPPASTTAISGGRLPDGTEVRAFDVFDECYCRIQRLGRSVEVAHHHHSPAAEPVAWVRAYGASRIAVDLLGHDERSYESAGRVGMLADLALWAVAASSVREL